MITIGHPTRNVFGAAYTLNIYGLRHEHIVEHVVRHLQTVLGYEEEHVQLEIFLNENEMLSIKDAVTALGFEQVSTEENELFCIEFPIK